MYTFKYVDKMERYKALSLSAILLKKPLCQVEKEANAFERPTLVTQKQSLLVLCPGLVTF